MFVSHATVDAVLVRAFVDFLVDGIGVPTEEIFCSSLPDFGIPTGQNSVEYMRSQIDGSLIVIMLMSPSYMARAFCQAEMGAAWVKAKEVFPIVVPPANFADVDGVMLGKQAIKVDDDIRYNELREKLAELVGFKPVKATRWDQKRKQFFGALPEMLTTLAKATSVPLATYKELEAKYDDALRDLEKQEEEIGRLKAEIVDLRKLKNSAQASEVAAKYADKTVSTEFERLALVAKKAIKTIGASGVRRLYLADRFGKPFDVRGWDQEDFDAAIRRNVLTQDCTPRRDHREVWAADQALDQMEKFVAANLEELEEYAEHHYTSPMEPDNEDFWNAHLL
ncbi:hypothetical protein X728_02635 [Mesorhizobium sp. L103C120A0]|nr:hypothetical protein X728_02635 [Mesorhizobium sp. L103C120A0]